MDKSRRRLNTGNTAHLCPLFFPFIQSYVLTKAKIANKTGTLLLCTYTFLFFKSNYITVKRTGPIDAEKVTQTDKQRTEWEYAELLCK